MLTLLVPLLVPCPLRQRRLPMLLRPHLMRRLRPARRLLRMRQLLRRLPPQGEAMLATVTTEMVENRESP